MSNRRKPVHSSDPRRVGGEMVGSGGPHDRGGVLLDTRRAVLLNEVMASTIDSKDGDPRGVALFLSGRINHTDERVRTLYLMGSDGVAAIVTELMALLGRIKGQDQIDLLNDIAQRMANLREEGNAE